MKKALRHSPSRFHALTIGVLLASSLTFALPKEHFDPHPGVGGDIFCKSLTFMGAEFQGGLLSVIACFVQVDDVTDPCTLLPQTMPGWSNTIRAPPFQTALPILTTRKTDA
ncbi:MAG TPA: hypothetical protein VLM75_09950 [Spirochaetota bacterium]|nr:hypothetical protein [Spirochaetota bacterium]